jgi:hypothetical protein
MIKRFDLASLLGSFPFCYHVFASIHWSLPYGKDRFP